MIINKQNPLIYIIIVNYNSSGHTIECIESINNIKYENYMVLVIDNNSSENEVKILEDYISDNNKVKLIKSMNNLGFAGGNNIGIEYALNNNAEYFLLLNNDTVVESDFLDELVNNLDESNGVGICVGKILYYYDKSVIWYAGGNINKFKGSTDVNGFVKDEGQFEEKESITFATGCCMLISREVIEKVGLLREDYFLYFEDSEYSMRTIDAGFKILYCPKSIIYHKESVSTVRGSFNNSYYFNRNRLLFIRDNFSGVYKCTSYFYTFIFTIFKVIAQKFEYKPVKLAYKHFISDIRGKIELNKK